MKNALILAATLLLTPTYCIASAVDTLKVGVERQGDTYLLNASFDTSLSQCAAYRYLTDYESAVNLPGVISSTAHREAENTVRVDRTAEERVLFMRVRLHSVLEFVEQPNRKVTFTQITGDSKAFSGSWLIEPTPQGSTLIFHGAWQPDTLLPLFVIDYFARHDLENRFGMIAQLAEAQKTLRSEKCH